MSRSLGPHIAPYLQVRVAEWLAADASRTAAELARLAGVSPAQISYVKRTGRNVGYVTATGLGRVFGLKTFGEVEAAADAWWSSADRRPKSIPPSRVEQPRLHDRPEWSTVLDAARQARAYVDDEAWARAGRLYDHEDMPRPLTTQIVADFGHAFFASSATRSA